MLIEVEVTGGAKKPSGPTPDVLLTDRSNRVMRVYSTSPKRGKTCGAV
ncbi:MAG: hypothetical protein CM1200mP22_06430 [Dehalococcoidia bacterium]|nr:MAG: hypothetical protein CM1200mP22_06430 [Dehalococcoidia bacterium]